MRVRVDRGADAVHLVLTDATPARRAEVADGVAVAYDAAGKVVGIEVRNVDPAALHEFTVELAGMADRPTTAHARAISPAHPAQAARAYDGPVSWDPEAEAAVAQGPFFRRGPVRLAAIALARQRGLDRVTVDIVKEARR